MLKADQPVTLNLLAADVQVVLTALAELPFRVSAPVIVKVEAQVKAIDPTAFGTSVEPMPEVRRPRRNGEAAREHVE